MKTINNFVIDHVLRGIMVTKKDYKYQWSINQITDPSLSITSETAESVDALGSPIATFDRGKNAEFSANNSLFDLGLFAAQNGVEKEVGGAGKKIVVPAFEVIDYTGEETYVLKHTPIAPLESIYLMNGDGTMGEAFGVGVEAGDSNFVYDEESHTITFPTGLTAGVQLFAMYDYETEQAVAVTGDAINFPKAGRFIMEVLGADTCDPDTQIHAYVDFPNAKLDANVDISFTTDGNHPFTIQCQQDYCDPKKVLYRVIIPNED